MFPLTGDPELDRDLVEERQRDYLERAEADRIADGDPAVQEGDYQPITDGEDDMVDTSRENKYIREDK